MTQAQSKSYGGVKKKLVGAVCMLLVASIMMVSSTYAWFTLSTAPEITGISTSVGANGNLEMALLTSGTNDDTNTYKNLDKITSAVGDSGKAVTEKNLTWGNLVDLKDASYGLGKIKLMPAALNITKEAAGAFTVTKDNLLATPTYGTDGRVADLSGKTYTAKYDGTNWAFNKDDPGYGVRAIGSNDNLTPQQAGLLGAKSEYNQALSAAKTTIQNALSTNGKGLSNAVMALALNGGNDQLEENQQTAIKAMVTAAESALAQIDKAYVALLKASVTKLDAAKYSGASGALNGKTTLEEAITALKDEDGTLEIPTELTTLQNTLKTNKDAVATAHSECTAGDYKAALTALVNADLVKVNSFTREQMISPDGQANSAFVNKVVKDGGAVVEMPDDSGVFAYIGSVAGNYAAPTEVDINYNGMTLTGFPATMKTTATENTTAGTLLAGIKPNGDAGANVSLSDTYGYALDMAFRTNAASSYLKLQTEAKQRVYGNSENTDTQGGGSYMAFKSTNAANGTANLTDETVKKLMGAIRVAFIDPETGAIYGIATLDNIQRAGDSLKGALKLNDLTATEGADPTYSLTASTGSDGTEAKLMDLEQNKAKKLTVIVYLDGDTVTNADVANAEISLEGSLNLQFSSSADLKPMENTALRNGKGTTGTTGGGTTVEGGGAGGGEDAP